MGAFLFARFGRALLARHVASTARSPAGPPVRSSLRSTAHVRGDFAVSVAFLELLLPTLVLLFRRAASRSPRPPSTNPRMLEDDAGTQPSVSQVLEVLRRHRNLVIAWCVLCAAVVVVVVLLRGPSFTARTSFIPQSRRNSSLAAGVAAQLGFALPGQDQTQSPNFYSDLAASDLVLQAVADSGAVDAARRRVSLADFFDVSKDAPAVTRARIVNVLRSRLSTNVVQKTGLVELSMRTKDPAVSASLLQQILGELERFNQGSRRSQASAERRFTERRFDEVRAELNTAEQRLVSFLEAHLRLRELSAAAIRERPAAARRPAQAAGLPDAVAGRRAGSHRRGS